MNCKENPVWQRLENFSFENPDNPVRFHEKLARRGKWTPEFTTEVIEDYRRFLFLIATTREILIPPPPVDLAWNININYYKSSWNALLKDILPMNVKRKIPDSEDNEEPQWDIDHYNRTLELYKQAFHTWPDASIWPDPHEWFYPKIVITGKRGKPLLKIPSKSIAWILVIIFFFLPAFTSSFKWSIIPMVLIALLSMTNGKLYGVKRYTWDGHGVTYYNWKNFTK